MKLPWTKNKERLQAADDMFQAIVRIGIISLKQEDPVEIPLKDIEILRRTAKVYLRLRYPK